MDIYWDGLFELWEASVLSFHPVFGREFVVDQNMFIQWRISRRWISIGLMNFKGSSIPKKLAKIMRLSLFTLMARCLRLTLDKALCLYAMVVKISLFTGATLMSISNFISKSTQSKRTYSTDV